MRYDCNRLLHPASVAVLGASDRPGSYGSQALLNLREIAYPGEVWGVNPNRGEAHGYPCVASIEELPVAADAVVVAIPAAGVPAAVEQAAARGCGGAVIFSAGFAEVPEGIELQRALVAAAEQHGLPVCGPNCNGIVTMHERCALWGDALEPRDPGAVALVSQSGNVAVNALATRRGLRFHTVIASGNQAVLSAADYLELLAGQDGVGSIALYLEDDGGPRLCDGLAACADAGVPVVVLKVGSSPAGARAAAAHSAALAGDQRVFRALIEEADAIWAADVHELLELAKTLAVPGRRPATGGGLAIMTCSGGDSAQGADEAAIRGLELPALAPATHAQLAELLPPAATIANPLDYTAMIWGERAALSELVRIVGEDPAIEQLLVFYDQPHRLTGASEESWRAVREGIIAGAALAPVRTLVSSTLPELLDDDAAWQFARSGVPAAAGLRTGVACAAAARAGRGDPERLRAIAATARRADGSAAGGDCAGEWLGEHESKELLRAAGIGVVEGRAVHDARDAVDALAQLGGRIVLKCSAAAIRHKTELGAVALDLGSEDDVVRAYERLATLAAELDGLVLAERMAPAGVELLVAAHVNGIVPALVVGLGGIWTELLDDVAVVPLPAGPDRVRTALRSLRGAALLAGGRDGRVVDTDAIVRLAVRVGELLLERDLGMIELNPVRALAAGAVALDAAICLRGAIAAAPAQTARGVARVA